MKTIEKVKHVLVLMAIVLVGSATMMSCNKDDEKESKTFNYAFNTGQLGAGSAYSGTHPSNFSVTMKVDEMEDNMTRITVTLMNTLNGETYMIHAHDAADPTTTPNGTPYNESPNSGVFVQMAAGNGSDVTISQEVGRSFNDIVSGYDGFFVVHDPTQTMSTTQLSTYLVVGKFARE